MVLRKLEELHNFQRDSFLQDNTILKTLMFWGFFIFIYIRYFYHTIGFGVGFIVNLSTVIFQFIGGVGLLLYGMKLMGDGIESIFGEKLKRQFETINTNPLHGVLAGTVVTAAIQSSSATTVMVVGFVNAGLMNLYQAAGVIMGANIGTTITGQLLAFKITAVAPLFIGIGSALIIISKGKKEKEIGSVLLGFGILFLGMTIVENSIKITVDTTWYISFIRTLSGNIFLSIFVGLCLTIVIQNSAVTIGILIALSAVAPMPLNVCIPIVLGDNIGSCTSALLSSVGTSKTAKKAALIHLIFNIIGVIIFSILLNPFIYAVTYISPQNVGRQIANSHTFFNIANTFIQVCFIPYLVKIVNAIIPGEDNVEEIRLKYLDERLLKSPVIAVAQTIKEINRMAKKAKENIEFAVQAFELNDDNLANKVYFNETVINRLENDITSFLVKLSNEELSEEKLNIVTSMFHVVNDIERIGDHAENIADLTFEKMQKRVIFSEQSIDEIKRMYSETINALDKSLESFKNNDKDIAQEVISIEEQIDICDKNFRENNINRLNKRICSPEASTIFLEILSNLERIGDHSTNIAEVILNR